MDSIKVGTPMGAAPAWYYRTQRAVFGPVSAATLKRLLDEGRIDRSTVVRKGEDGPWIPAERILGALNPSGKAEPDGTSDDETIELADPVVIADSVEPAEWYFSSEGRHKLGPVPRSVLIAMAAQGKLKSSDPLWRPGMASWVAASELPDFREGFSDSMARPPARDTSRFKPFFSSRARLGGTLLAIALIAGATAAGWVRIRNSPNNQNVSFPDRTPRAPASKASTIERSEPQAPIDDRPDDDDTENLVEIAMEAVRRGDLAQAKRLLDQYLSGSGVRKQIPKARAIRREIDLAVSESEAGGLARHLTDEQIKDYLGTEARLVVEASVKTPELRPLYARVLLEALRKESDRRRSAAEQAGALAQRAQIDARLAPDADREAAGDEDADAARLATTSLLGSDDDGPGDGPDRKAGDGLARRPKHGESITIEKILDSIKDYEDQTITLDGLYKIGTRISELRGPDGNIIGSSLPVGGDDDRLISRGDSKVVGRDGYLVLDGGLTSMLEQVFDRLRFKTAIRPTYKCTMTITVRAKVINNARVPIAQITGLEILGVCNFLQVAQRQYAKAFWTVHVTPERAFVAYGDGPEWVERLGGEEKFVKPLRRKLRDLQRRLIADRQHAIIGSVIQAELGRSVNMAMAAQQQHARFAAALIGAR